MKKYGNTEWQYMAAMARDYASRMQSNYDTDEETGERIYAIVDKFDGDASSELQRLYAEEGVEAVNICTYQGGYQTISVKYSDGTEITFDTNGRCDSMEDMICHEIYAYITGSINESSYNNAVRLTESKLKQIIAESINRVLSESKVYTMDDLRRHRAFRVGQIVDDEVIEDLAHDKYIEPRVWNGTVLQLGEPYDETGYDTFMVTKDGWVYVGTRY